MREYSRQHTCTRGTLGVRVMGGLYTWPACFFSRVRSDFLARYVHASDEQPLHSFHERSRDVHYLLYLL